MKNLAKWQSLVMESERSRSGRRTDVCRYRFRTRCRNCRRGEWAFTLIEILIAVAIFSVVVLAIYSAWTSILRGSKVALSAAAEAQRTRMAMRAINEALGATQLFLGSLSNYWFQADTSGGFGALSFVSHLPSSFPGSGLFGDQVVRRVTFSVEQNQLKLRQIPLLEPPDSQAHPYTIVLAPNVSRFDLEFLDTNSVEWLTEWIPTNQLPKVVKVTLGFGQKGQGNSKLQDVAVQTVFLTSSAIPRALQLPPGRPGAPPVAPGRGAADAAGGLSQPGTLRPGGMNSVRDSVTVLPGGQPNR
jgi:prepilin-type N-terminal cleavage/methylation domain-containing protein